MQLKTVYELGNDELIGQGYQDHYTMFDDDCGLCGEDVGGIAGTVPVVAIVDGEPRADFCSVYTDSDGVIRVANTEELVRCFA
jgi:hypothetical protein